MVKMAQCDPSALVWPFFKFNIEFASEDVKEITFTIQINEIWTSANVFKVNYLYSLLKSEYVLA